MGAPSAGPGESAQPDAVADRLLDAMLRELGEAVVVTDHRYQIQEWSAAAARLFGWSAEEARGREARELLGWTRLDDHLGGLGARLARGERVRFRCSSRHKDGTRLATTVDVAPWGEAPAPPRGFVVIARDVAREGDAEQALQESEERFRSIIEACGEGIVKRRVDGTVTAFNPAAERLLGVTKSQIEGLEPIGEGLATIDEHGALIPVEERPSRVALRTGQPIARVVGVSKPDGSLTWLHVNAQPLRRPGEPHYAVVTTFTDITLQRQLQEKLLTATRLASVCTLAAGVAHEINNPLASVTSNLVFSLEQLRQGSLAAGADQEELREALEDAVQAAQRIRSIVGSMRSLGRPGDLYVPRVIDVRDEILSAVELVRGQLAQRARVDLDVPEDLPWARARTNELGRVVVNLLVNAAQAIPEGDPAGNRIAVVARADGDDVVIEVADTGAGIAPEIRPRIFEPFFTTKPPGQGMGLGLSIVKTVVDGAGGHVAVTSAPGAGATFRVRLPAVRAPSG